MPISFSIEGKVLTFYLEGQYGLPELKDAQERAIQHPEYVQPMYLLADAREAKVNPPLNELREIARFFLTMRHYYHKPWVVVVSDPLRYGLTRMVSVFIEHRGMELLVYQNMESAMAALDKLQAGNDPHF